MVREFDKFGVGATNVSKLSCSKLWEIGLAMRILETLGFTKRDSMAYMYIKS